MRVPVRLDVERWATRQTRKRVLAVVHTVTAGRRLLDAIRLLDGDPRVQVFFTAAPDVFSNGVATFLAEAGALVLPWSQAVQTEFDLALAAAHDGLHELHAPVIVLSHGAGYNKYVPAATGGREVARPRGVRTQPAAADTRWRRDPGGHRSVASGGAVPPRPGVPRGAPRCGVVGDPCFDRLAASFSSRAFYREALRVDPDQQLSSPVRPGAPGPCSARDWELLERLVPELPHAGTGRPCCCIRTCGTRTGSCRYAVGWPGSAAPGSYC